MRQASKLFASVALSSIMSHAYALGLLDAYQAALVQDRQWRGAMAQSDADREALPQAQAKLNPAIAFSNSYLKNQLNRSDLVDFNQRYPSRSNSLTLRQPLYQPKAFAQVDAAQAAMPGIDAELEKSRQAVAVRLMSAYFQLVFHTEKQQLLEAQTELLATKLISAEMSFRSGRGTRTDIDEIRAQRDALLVDALQVKQAAILAGADVHLITGVWPKQVQRPHPQNFNVSDLQPAPFEIWLERVMKTSPELRAKLARAQSLNAGLRVAGAERKPTLDFVTQVVESHGESPYFVNARTLTRAVGVQLNVPIYQGGYEYSRERQALAIAREGQEQAELAAQTVEQELRKTYFELTEGLTRVRALETARHSARQSKQSNQKSFEAGVRTVLDVLQAEQRLLQVESDLLQAKLSTLSAWLRLHASAAEIDMTIMQTLGHHLSDSIKTNK
jgi:protease secretion system outer membrane protein